MNSLIGRMSGPKFLKFVILFSVKTVLCERY